MAVRHSLNEQPFRRVLFGRDRPGQFVPLKILVGSHQNLSNFCTVMVLILARVQLGPTTAG